MWCAPWMWERIECYLALGHSPRSRKCPKFQPSMIAASWRTGKNTIPIFSKMGNQNRLGKSATTKARATRKYKLVGSASANARVFEINNIQRFNPKQDVMPCFPSSEQTLNSTIKDYSDISEENWNQTFTFEQSFIASMPTKTPTSKSKDATIPS